MILVGDERHLARAVRRGATGAVSGIANIAADLVMDAVAGNDDPRLSAMVDTIGSHPMIPALKHLLAVRTGPAEWSRLLPPLPSLAGGAAERLSSEITEALDATTIAQAG